MKLLELVDPLRKILDDASKAILEIYKDPSLFEVNHKKDNSPLTAADMASNEIICEGLKTLDPSIPIVSEENRTIPYTERQTYEYFWCVDPLDGTKEFIQRNGEFTINVALVKQDRAVLGIITVPVSGECFVGIDGEGARKYFNGRYEKIHCRQFDEKAEGLGLVCSRSHLNEQTQKYISRFSVPELHPRGSALKFTVLATGQADVYPRLGPTMEWDTAAAQIILEEAGGSLVQWDSREPVVYNKESLLNPNFLAFGQGKLSF